MSLLRRIWRGVRLFVCEVMDDWSETEEDLFSDE